MVLFFFFFLRYVLWVFITIDMHLLYSVTFYFEIPFKRLGSIISRLNFKWFNLT